jgi:hypothetical protein
MFLGFVCEFLRPVEAYFDFPCISGSEVALEFDPETKGNDVVPVR